MGYQTAPHGSLGLPCGLYQFLPLTEGTALLFEYELVLYPAFVSTFAPTTHPTCPPPIDSISDITGTEKNSQKPAAFK